MKTLSLLLATVWLATALPDAHAQSSDGWWDWAARSDRYERNDDRSERRDRDDRSRRGDEREDRRWDRGDRRDRNARGPKFCQNGQGHPTKGMRWCYEKGFVTPRDARRADRRAPRWERRTVEDIIFGSSRQDRRRIVVQPAALRDILGRTRFVQLERAADGPLAARWVYPSRTVRVLQIRDRRGPLVELTDLNGDGRVDVFLTNSLR